MSTKESAPRMLNTTLDLDVKVSYSSLSTGQLERYTVYQN